MKKWTYGIGMIFLIILTGFMLPIWRVPEIQISGISIYSPEEIKNVMTFKENMHLLQMNKDQMQEELMQLPYIKMVECYRKWPNQVFVDVTERRPLGYVKFLDSYVAIDEDGYVVEQSNQKRMDLPEIEGLKFKYATIGQPIELENKDQLQGLKEMIRILQKYEFVAFVDTIEVTNMQQINLYVGRLNVIIGNIRDFDKKVRYLIEVHQQYAMGILDLSFIDTKQAILKPMS